jgi:hypothetical protein
MVSFNNTMGVISNSSATSITTTVPVGATTGFPNVLTISLEKFLYREVAD